MPRESGMTIESREVPFVEWDVDASIRSNHLHRFMVFRFERYYPLGGMDDCLASYATLEEAKESVNVSEMEDYPIFVQIFDRATGETFKLNVGTRTVWSGL